MLNFTESERKTSMAKTRSCHLIVHFKPMADRLEGQDAPTPTNHDDISPQRWHDAKSSPPQMRGCCGRRPWQGWWATRGIQPPRADRCHVKASQAFTPSL